MFSPLSDDGNDLTRFMDRASSCERQRKRRVSPESWARRVRMRKEAEFSAPSAVHEGIERIGGQSSGLLENKLPLLESHDRRNGTNHEGFREVDGSFRIHLAEENPGMPIGSRFEDR